MGHYKQIQIQGQRHTFHRYLMEQHTGRKLLPNEIVHHIDGNKHNNQVSNFEIRDRRERNVLSGRLNRPNAKLSKADVIVIKKMLKGGIKQWLIGFAYGMSRVCISNINTGRKWQWI